jgi:hypothetical protein
VPYCQTPGCGKRDLKPEEIVFDDQTQILRCLECSERSRLVYSSTPGNPAYVVNFSSAEGIFARFNYQGVAITVGASMESIKKLFTRARGNELCPTPQLEVIR